MKIALMTNNYKPFIGGVPISVERLADGLRKEGHEVTVFAPTYEDWQKENDTCNEVRYHSLIKNVAGGIVIPNPIDPKIEKSFKKGDFDIIHVHHPIAIGNTAVYLSKKYNVPLFFTYHTRYEQYLHYLKPIMWLEKGAKYDNNKYKYKIQKAILDVIQERLVPGYLKSFMKNCHHIFAPTEGMRKYLINICDIDEDKVSVLPTGLKEESFHGELQNIEKIRDEYKAKDCPLFLSVSRIAHEKNIPFLIEALAYYKMVYKKPFRMLFVGEGPNRAEYEEMVKKIHMENEIFFIGGIANEKLPDYYRAADLFLFASKTETQGIVIIETMAAETPVIAVKATGVSDIVKDGINGYLTKEDVSDFAEHIDLVMTQPSLLKELEKSAFETAYSYSQTKVAKRAAIMYQSIIDTNCKETEISIINRMARNRAVPEKV